MWISNMKYTPSGSGGTGVVTPSTIALPSLVTLIQPITQPVTAPPLDPATSVTSMPSPEPESIIVTQAPTSQSERPTDLESVVITSRPRLEIRPFTLEGSGGGTINVGGREGSRAPSVVIVRPSDARIPSFNTRKIYYNVDNLAGTRSSEADLDREELEVLLRLAKERLRAKTLYER